MNSFEIVNFGQSNYTGCILVNEEVGLSDVYCQCLLERVYIGAFFVYVSVYFDFPQEHHLKTNIHTHEL